MQAYGSWEGAGRLHIGHGGNPILDRNSGEKDADGQQGQMYRDLPWIVPDTQGLLAGLHHAWVYARSFTAGDSYPGPAHANTTMVQCNTGTAGCGAEAA